MTAAYSNHAGTLTPRMRDVLAAAAAGRTAQQTAADLNVTVATVWTVRAALCNRLGAPNMPAAVYAAVRRGELP